MQLDRLPKDGECARLAGVDTPDASHLLSEPPRGQYKWLHKKGTQIVQAPTWLLDLLRPKGKQEGQPAPRKSDSSPYAEKALIQEVAMLTASHNGCRNDQLNRAAFSLGQLVGGGELSQSHVEAMLTTAALTIGLDERETKRTIASGLKKGMADPRHTPERDEDFYTGQTGHTRQAGQTGHLEETPDTAGQRDALPDTTGRPVGEPDTTGQGKFPAGSLWAEVRKWVESSSGSFYGTDIDRDLGLTTRREKKSRSDCLAQLVLLKTLRKDKEIRSKFHTTVETLQEVDWDEVKEEPYPISLPLGLDDLVAIGPRTVILLEGVTNAGKTAIALDALLANMESQSEEPPQLLYLFSEGGPAEILSRVRSSGYDLATFKQRVRASDCPRNQAWVIQDHNPDGITVVDFLEPQGGEYFRLGQQVSEIWESLGQGVAIVCLQKKTGCTIGRGGEAIREKPRLSMTLDVLDKAEGYVLVTLKIVKCKTPRNPRSNPDGKECHLAIVEGSRLVQLSDWRYCSEKEYEALIPQYRLQMERIFERETPRWEVD